MACCFEWIATRINPQAVFGKLRPNKQTAVVLYWRHSMADLTKKKNSHFIVIDLHAIKFKDVGIKFEWKVMVMIYKCFYDSSTV